MAYTASRIFPCLCALVLVSLTLVHLVMFDSSFIQQTLTIFPEVFRDDTFKRPVNVTPGTVCVKFLGRLGNQMFQYASMYGIARTKGMAVLIGEQDQISKYFKISAYKTNHQRYCNFNHKIHELYAGNIDNNVLNFNSSINTEIGKYLQSWRYFYNFSEEIRQEFKFKDHIIHRARTVFSNAVSYFKNVTKETVFVGIHIRRGDMVVERKVAPAEYVTSAIKFYCDTFHNPVFIASSDDIKWVKDLYNQTASIGYEITFMDDNSAEVDLAVLSMCNHTIMTVGTFGWWAAWLAGGMNVYYKDFIPDTEIGARYSKNFNGSFENYFMPQWIGM